MRRYCFRFPILLSRSPRLPTFSDIEGASIKGDFHESNQAENSSFTCTIPSKETHKRIPITVRYSIWETFVSPTRAILCRLGYIQLASVTFALIFFFTEYFSQWKDPASTTDTAVHILPEFLRLLSLLSLAGLTILVFGRPEDKHPFKYHKTTALEIFVVSLQVNWLLFEINFGSVFWPILPGKFALEDRSKYFYNAFPTATMVAWSGCLNWLSLLRSRHQRDAKDDPNSGDEFYAVAGTTPTQMSVSETSRLNHYSSSCSTIRSFDMKCELETSTSLSSSTPRDSGSPDSLGGINCDLPSPTCHLFSPKNSINSLVERRCPKEAFEDSNIYLQMHTLDSSESVMFVHKRLTPIKVKSPPSTEIDQKQQNQSKVKQAKFSTGNSILRSIMQQAEQARAQKIEKKENIDGVVMLPRPATDNAGAVATLTLVPKYK